MFVENLSLYKKGPLNKISSINGFQDREVFKDLSTN